MSSSPLEAGLNAPPVTSSSALLPIWFVPVKKDYVISLMGKNIHANNASVNSTLPNHPAANVVAASASGGGYGGDTTAATNTTATSATTVSVHDAAKPKEEHQFMSSRKRNRDNHKPIADDRLCSFIMKSQPCPFKDCKYNHDVKQFLEKKPEDLGESCYLFETFGWCSSGLMCRFGSSHIDKETSMNVVKPAFQNRVLINNLRKELQQKLRKRDKYNFNEKIVPSQFETILSPHQNSGVNSDGADGEVVDADFESATKRAASAGEDSSVTLNAEPDVEVVSSHETESSASASSSSAAGCGEGGGGQSESNVTIKRTTRYSENSAVHEGYVKLVDFSNKVYVAPLTTVGNLPFRRILKDFGADITCGEMAMGDNILNGQASEWALLRRHQSEDVYGVQIACSKPDEMVRISKLLNNETSTDFVDLNCGCPIDVLCKRGCGAAMLNKPNRLIEVVKSMVNNFDRSVTVKIRTGWEEKNPTSHKLVPMIQEVANGKIAAIFMHGRSRLQRYHRLANWDYVLECARAQTPDLPRIPVVGNGDIFSWADWESHQSLLSENMVDAGDSCDMVGLCNTAMIGRGALIKPWLPTELKEKRHWDISATERLDLMKKFCNYGLEHWGSDQQGVNNTRRFLLEWMSFLCRYVPVGLVEVGVQTMSQRPPHYFGRCDLETLLASTNSKDWIRISELLLGPAPDGYNFEPKHKSNSYAPEAELVADFAKHNELGVLGV